MIKTIVTKKKLINENGFAPDISKDIILSGITYVFFYTDKNAVIIARMSEEKNVEYEKIISEKEEIILKENFLMDIVDKEQLESLEAEIIKDELGRPDEIEIIKNDEEMNK